MKTVERELARELRRQGHSLGEIREMLGVSKSSVSMWVRDIELTAEQMERLARRYPQRGNNPAGREKFSQTMRRKREEKIAAYYREAEQEYAALSQDVEFMFGLALYVGEGAKSSRGMVAISNCDPGVILKSIAFFERIGVARERIRCRIILHPGQPDDEALTYWEHITGLARDHFRVNHALTRASQGKAPHRQPHGTCSVYVGSTVLHFKIARWMELSLAS